MTAKRQQPRWFYLFAALLFLVLLGLNARDYLQGDPAGDRALDLFLCGMDGLLFFLLLDSAHGWGTWDLVGGGLVSDLAKYGHLDDAQEQIERLQVALRRFKTELADVEIDADVQVTVDGFLKFADFFFDNLFTDWAVLDRIGQSQQQVQDTRRQIERVLARLKRMAAAQDSQMEDERERLEQIAREAEG